MWLILVVVAYAAMLTAKEQIYYADFEHPNVTYFNPKHIEYVTFKAQRYSRRDPIHYINFHTKILTEFGNDFMWTVHFYEYLSNEYRPSMVIMRFRICDVISDPKFDIMKPIYIQFFKASSCPFKKGEYKVTNASLSNTPLLRTFPFRLGRVYLTLVKTGRERIFEAYIDVAIKVRYL